MTSNSVVKDTPTMSSALDSSFAKIDWQAPWLCHLSQLKDLNKTVKQRSEVNQQADTSAYNNEPHEPHESHESLDIIAKVLNSALKQQSTEQHTPLSSTKPTKEQQAHTLKFVSQNALPEGEAYEHFIATTGNIPTRDNLHDLFNGSIWLTFPKTKALLNHYHMLEIAKQGIGESRGRVRDTITVFDENGAVLVTSNPSIGKALVDFDWQGSLVKTRAQWDDPKQPNSNAHAAVYIFGHALIEQLVQPRKPLCAHSVVINVSQDFFTLSTSERMTFLDATLANYMDELLARKGITPRQLAPLPILGVPHFWAENVNAEFYQDSYVFRSGRQRKSS